MTSSSSATDTTTITATFPPTVDEWRTAGREWWRSAVIYQIYPRSFADSTGDGIGDLAGITSRLDALADLGVDAIWLSPFFTSPQKDAGYDVADYCDVDPRFGTLADFDRMLSRAHDLALRVIVDIVPNHTSDQHEWFQAALASAEGSPERARYLFRDGKGEFGELSPNNWESVFGGPAWTRITNPDGTAGQWYLHLFDTSQPDLDWENPRVREQFRNILRFWLDRGVDGFRVDVAHGMIKAAGLPNYTPHADGPSVGMGGVVGAGEGDGNVDTSTAPFWAQDGVHEIYRDWRVVLDHYEGDRVLCAEAWVEPLTKLARWVRPDEMHQAFNFSYLETPWAAPALRAVIDNSLDAFSGVGAPSTWVLSNHDVVRHASRLALTFDNPQGAGIGPDSPGRPNQALGLRRARAATAVMVALPGSAYLYQGEELGLPEAIDLPAAARQDPTWFRTNGERYGRDGCRVPLPWKEQGATYGFNNTAASWLPQPRDWSTFSREAQRGVTGSTLELYTDALRIRSALSLGFGSIEWIGGFPETVLAFRNGSLAVIANIGSTQFALPSEFTAHYRIALRSGVSSVAAVSADTTVWLERVSATAT
jgi:alpha-glucosidase